MPIVFDAISLLTPWDINLNKIRIGERGDGGYVLANTLRPPQPVLSYGIGARYGFDREMAERGHRVFMYDHTIGGVTAPHINMRFKKEGVAGRRDPSIPVATIDDQVRENNIDATDIILKIDVEGAEYDVFSNINTDTLQRFEQIVMEIHFLHNLADTNFRTAFITAFSVINEYFTLFHVHANNHDGPDKFRVVDNLLIPQTLELSYIKSSMITRKPSQTVYPTEFDYPNTPKPDKLLWTYPFAPMSVSVDAYRASLRRQRRASAAMT